MNKLRIVQKFKRMLQFLGLRDIKRAEKINHWRMNSYLNSNRDKIVDLLQRNNMISTKEAKVSYYKGR